MKILNIKNIIIILLVITFMPLKIYAGENEQLRVKIFNNDMTSYTQQIKEKTYIMFDVIENYYEDYEVTQNGDGFYGIFDGKTFSCNINEYYFYINSGYYYTEKPKVLDGELYVPLEFFAYLLEADYKKTNCYELIDTYLEGKDYSFTENNLIAHALGGYEGVAVTNSLESFLSNYEKGFRVFEVDLQYTYDAVLVAAHDFKNPFLYAIDPELKNDVTYEEFKKNKIYGNLTSLSFEDVVNLMVEYDDIYIITDTKYTGTSNVTKQFTKIIETVNRIEPSVIDRIVPQIYTYEMYDTVKSINDFNAYIFTLYQLEDLDIDYLTNFVYENGINVVTMDSYRASNELLYSLNSYGIETYVHTINDLSTMDSFLKKGVTGFYTDFISNEDLQEILN